MASTGITDEERAKLKQLFVEYYEDVPVIKYAAGYIGIAESTAHDWLDQDSDFRSLVEQAKSRWARKRALKTKAEFQLERLDKDIWVERKEHTGKDGDALEPVIVKIINEPPRDTNTE